MHLDLALFSAVVVFTLMFLKVPVFASILAGSAIYFAFNPAIPPYIIAQRVISGVESIPLLAIAFFIFAGIIFNYSGVTKRIMDFCEVMVGRMPGGLAQVSVLLSTVMGGLCGSNLADAAMEAKMLVPEMEKRGIPKAFGTVIVAVSAIITPLIPPGIAMIIYGSVTNTSIGRLFIAGIGPGLLLCFLLMILVWFISKKRGYRPLYERERSLGEFLRAFKEAFWALILPVVIIGGIRVGVFTPTEAGAIAIVYAFFLALMYREMKIRDLLQAIKETIITTSSIMLIIAAASTFAWILTRERVPQEIAKWILANIPDKYMFLLAVNIFLLIVGMIMEGNAAIVILAPLLAPVAAKYGIDDIHFGMIFIFNLAIGCLTPPVGTLMFVSCGITKCKTRDFIIEAIPFYGLLLFELAIITVFPVFTTGLVNLLWR
ncbi:MAG: TRAP transporter large permease [Synergistetes bacterium]|nr:TRAP transporter large permease [Synergistota bacterium]MDW8191708.1 TRAP transporter large permease [Synergistota bacterium]